MHLGLGPLSVQNKRKRGNEGQVVVEQTLLIGVLMLALLLVILFYVAPVFSKALWPVSHRISGPGFWRFGAKAAHVSRRPAYATRAGGRERRPEYYDRQRADIAVLMTAAQREELEREADLGLGTTPDAQNARALLMAADGAAAGDIARNLGVSEKSIRQLLWKSMARPVVCSEGVCRGHLPVRVRARRAAKRIVVASAPRKVRSAR